MSICALAVTPHLTVTLKPAFRAKGNFFFYSQDILQYSDYRKKNNRLMQSCTGGTEELWNIGLSEDLAWCDC